MLYRDKSTASEHVFSFIPFAMATLEKAAEIVSVSASESGKTANCFMLFFTLS